MLFLHHCQHAFVDGVEEDDGAENEKKIVMSCGNNHLGDEEEQAKDHTFHDHCRDDDDDNDSCGDGHDDDDNGAGDDHGDGDVEYEGGDAASVSTDVGMLTATVPGSFCGSCSVIQCVSYSF